MRLLKIAAVISTFFCSTFLPAEADTEVYLAEVPDYTWYAGCFGTACGNLMGFWDRHGLPDFYTGPTGGGVAPLDSFSAATIGIRSMMASKAGLDGRPANMPGHIDDYWRYYVNDGSFSYEDTVADPYQTAGRAEHAPDCIGDFIGVSQRKWTNMNAECDGNIDAYSFVYWDKTGSKRTNFVPAPQGNIPVSDIQSGLRAWTRYRQYDCDVVTQLADFNPNTPAGKGFTYEDMKAEINAGYPVLLFLQPANEMSRNLGTTMPKANPEIHGMLAYGYEEYPDIGVKYVHYRTSWGGVGQGYHNWDNGAWEGLFPVRGIICYHPWPRVRAISRNAGNVTIRWDGPSAQLQDALAGTTTNLHRYQVERAFALPGSWKPVAAPMTERASTFAECCSSQVFYRVKLLGPGE